MVNKQTAAEQVDILAPEITLTIAGREVRMREPTWVESLDLEPVLEPCVTFMREQLDGTEITPDASDEFLKLLLHMMRAHKTEMVAVMAFCGDVEPAWVEALNDADGRTFMLLYWRVNWHFFVRRLNLSRALAASCGRTVGAESSAH